MTENMSMDIQLVNSFNWVSPFNILNEINVSTPSVLYICCLI